MFFTKAMIMEHKDNQYATLSEAVDDLKRQGYADELRLAGEGLYKGEDQLDASLFTIDSFHRFEGASDPADMSIVYAISAPSLGLKGLLIGAYGPEAEAHFDRMVRPLEVHRDKGGTQPVQPAAPGADVKV